MFKAILLAFAVIALVVASFSINNTFSILIAQRSRESALLRALGASRRQVLTSVVVEAIAIGAFASAVRPRRRLRPRRRPEGDHGQQRTRPRLRRGGRDQLDRRDRHRGRDRLDPARQLPPRPAGVASRSARRTPRLGRRHVGHLEAPAHRRTDRVRRSASPRWSPRRTPTRRSGRPGSERWPTLVGAVVLGPVVARPAAACSASAHACCAARPAASPAATRCATRGARRQRVGTDGRHRRRGPVHHVRCVDQGDDRTDGRPGLRRRPRHRHRRLQRCRAQPGRRPGGRRAARGRRGGRDGECRDHRRRQHDRTVRRRARRTRRAARPRRVRRIARRRRGRPDRGQRGVRGRSRPRDRRHCRRRLRRRARHRNSPSARSTRPRRTSATWS